MRKNWKNTRTKKGKLLDVGAAAGFILQGFTDAGWRGIGLEPNVEMARFGRDKFNLDVRCGSLESFETGERFDLISMIQVVAHFYNPRAAFEKAADLLNENGFLLVETWNRASLSARLFGANWHEYSPPSVLQWFSETGLTQFLKEFSFEKIARGLFSARNDLRRNSSRGGFVRAARFVRRFNYRQNSIARTRRCAEERKRIGDGKNFRCFFGDHRSGVFQLFDLYALPESDEAR